MSLASRCVRRPVAVAMFFVAVAVVGLISAFRLPIDLLPNVAYPRLVVYTTWSNVAPLEVQRLLSEPIERAVARVPGVERVESVSREGVSLVTLRFAWGSDMDFAALAVREQLDNMRDALPEQAERPAVLRTDPTAEPVMSVSVAGRELWALRDLAEAVFKRRLEQIDGIAQAAVTGGLEREIQVDVDPRALEAHGLAITDVADALAAANVSAPGGTIRRGRYRYALRTLGELEAIGQIADVPLGSGAAAAPRELRSASTSASPPSLPGVVRIRDVATVTDGWRERDAIARFDGAESVGLLLYKESGANTVRVAEQVEQVLDQLRAQYPEISLDVASSQAGFISQSISSVVQALLIGGALAFLVLFVFLRDPRYPMAVALSIPISVVATFALMDAFGVSLNIMSLGGLALGVGMLVDNSIVVLENIARRRAAEREEGKGKGAAMPDHRQREREPERERERLSPAPAVEEVQSAITASTLTTIAVFGPIVYVEGVAGELFGDLSLAVAASLLVSLLVALTVLPTIAARWSERAVAVPLLEGFERVFERLAARYHRALEWALAHPGRVLGTTTAALGLALLVGLALPRSILPDVDQGAFTARLELPLGTPLERTSEVAAAVERVLLADDDVDAVFAHVGRRRTLGSIEERRSGANTAAIDVRLRGDAATHDVLERIGPRVRRAAGDATLAFETGNAGTLGAILGGAEADLSIGVLGDDFDRTLEYARALAAALAAEDELRDVRLGVEVGQPEVRVRVDRDAVARYGLDVAQVAAAVEAAMHGRTATHFVDFDRRVPVVVRLPEAERRSLATLDRLAVGGVAMRELIATEATVGPSELRRAGQSGVVPVLAGLGDAGLSGAVAAVETTVARMPPPQGVRVDVGGATRELRRSLAGLAFAFGLALLLVYMIMAAQFESLVQPLVILASVPLALIGALFALGLAGAGLNTISLIGIVILIGIVVNDAIVKVDFVNQARARGAGVRDALLEAGAARFRPILMTTITTIFGLLPLALGLGRGADLRAPLAIAVIGGLVTSTALTLVVVPVLYQRIEKLRERMKSDVAVMGAVLVMLPILLGACGDAGAGAAGGIEPSVRDSAGIAIVENPAPPDSGGALALAPEPELVIGVLEGEPEYQLYQVGGVARLADGRIAVANGGSGEVRYFDASGRFVSASGRKGRGPGEFQGMGDMWSLAGDSLVVFDWDLDRFTLLDERGGFVQSRNLRRGSGSLGFPIGMLGAEHVVLRQSGWSSSSDRPGGTYADTMRLRLLNWRDEQAAAGEPILTFAGGQAYVYRTERMSIFTPVFLSPVPQPVVLDGAIHLGLGTDFGFHVYDRNGTLQRIVRREHRREPLTREMRDAAVERRLEQIENENFRRTQREVMAGMPVPTHLPAHGRMTIDRLGRIWMQRFDLRVGEITLTDVPVVWDVFDVDGRWIAAVRTPPRFGARDIGADYVLGIAVDEFDVEQVRLYRLSHTP